MVTFRFRVILLIIFFLFQASPARSAAPEETTLYAVGDVMLGRYIAKVMATRGNDYPFQQITATLHNGDIVFGNLEAVISADGVTPAFPEKPYNFHATKQASQALKKAGFTVLNLANNHAMDYGPAALAETHRLLNENGIVSFGAGTAINEARQPAILVKNGVRFGFLGYGVAHARAVYAAKNHGGITPVVMDSIRKDIRELRNKVDVLIVSLHWGMEYSMAPAQKQREEAHQIIDWGADLILGHHPHVMQGIEIYKGKVIAYSLGNFVFDQKGNWTDRSFLLACKFQGKALSSAEIIPLDRFRTYFPKVAEGKTRTDVLEELKKISLPINSEPQQLSRVGLRISSPAVTP